MTEVSVHGSEVRDTIEECPHCNGTKHILDEVETTFGEFEEVSYLCHMCLGTGIKMDKAERDRRRA